MLEARHDEIWRDIRYFEGFYQISNFGRIKSLARVIPKISRGGRIVNLRLRERFLKPGDAKGYLFVMLSKNGKQSRHLIHILVLEHFVSARPHRKMEGCHNDGNYKNNKLDNLRWDTHKGNHQDRLRHGTSNRGIKNGCAKLTDDCVRSIRSMYGTGNYLMKDLGVIFSVHPVIIRRVVRGLSWKHVV